MKKTAEPQTIQTLFGEEISFRRYCIEDVYKQPKKKDTRSEIEKQDIYIVEDNEISELICARSHGHARSIYLEIIGESWNFTEQKLSIRKQHALKPFVQEHRLTSQIDTFCELVIRELYELGCSLVIENDDDETKLSLKEALSEDYDAERAYWSIPKKSKKICNKKNKKNASEISGK
jgi:hypothetical protein